MKNGIRVHQESIIITNQYQTRYRNTDEYYHLYVDGFLSERSGGFAAIPPNILFNRDVIEGEYLEYFLSGSIRGLKFSFDYVRDEDRKLNNKPVLYIQNYSLHEEEN